MNWFYADTGQQHGPISQAEFDALVASGVINDATLVWHDGLATWTPWGSLRPAEAAATAPPQISPPSPLALRAGRVLCVECGREFAEEDTIAFGSRRVCAACKPVFLQRLTEGAALGRASGQQATLEEIATRDYPLGIGRAWDRALAVFKQDPWMLMAALLVIGMLIMGIALAGGMAGLVVPLASNVISLFVTGQLTAGLYLVFLQRMRGEPVNLATAFRGFGPRYWQLTLCQLVQTGVMLGFGLIMGLGMAPAILIGIRSAKSSAPTPEALLIAGMIVGGLVAIVAMCVLFYFLVAWMFSLPLILDKGLDFWPAMKLSRQVVTRHPWHFSWLVLVISLFSGLGLILCGVGVILTGTLSVLMLVSVYEDMFGDLAPQQRL